MTKRTEPRQWRFVVRRESRVAIIVEAATKREASRKYARYDYVSQQNYCIVKEEVLSGPEEVT